MNNLDNLRHSCAHLLAAAVMELWPDTKRTIGPPIDDGFYYDFEFKIPISESDLPKIEKKMSQILQSWKSFQKIEVSVADAKKEFKNNRYKLELIDEFSKDNKKLTLYRSGNYIDLCKGGHSDSPSKDLRFFKLLKIAGAYWRGNSDNKMLTRIYGTAFPTKEELDSYIKMLDEAKKRDHRVLGEQLGLFFFHEYSPGSPFFLPKGFIIYNELVSFIRTEYKNRGYQEVMTPLLYEKSLWETSGHWEHYKDNMFNLESEKKVFSLKPMNCPSHCLIFKHKSWSYRDLPLRIADFAPLHRNELSGTLSGLTRVRKFSQDDSHIFISEDQLESELNNVLDFVKFVYSKTFNLDFNVSLGTRPNEFMGEKKLWDKAEKVLESVLKKNKIKYAVSNGDGAFYGPKIDFRIKDALNREHQLATVQLDFQMPLRFDLSYIGVDGNKHTPIMIHRAVLGSVERFIALLVENFTGKFPVWLSPVQVKIITVADRHTELAESLLSELSANGVRVELDSRSESIPKKVREAQLMKIPYIITVGDKEIESNELAVRSRDNNLYNFKKRDFINKILGEIKNKNV